MNRKLATTNQQKTRQYNEQDTSNSTNQQKPRQYYEHDTSNSTNQQKPRQYYEHDTSYYKPTKAKTIIRT